MIKSFRHKGLELFYDSCSVKGIQAKHSKKLRMQLAALDTANNVEDLNIPCYRLHQLKGDLNGLWSITVNANWRITFQFSDSNVYIVNYEDYH